MVRVDGSWNGAPVNESAPMNQRVQSFIPDQTGTFYSPYKQWDVNAWIGQSLDNKPFIAVGSNNHVFITDPEGYRVIEFTSNGEFVRTWGDFGTGDTEIGLALTVFNVLMTLVSGKVR